MSSTALVTGATKGIGKAVAIRLLKEGWNVVGTYAHDKQAAEAFLADCSTLAPERIHLLCADSSDLSSIEDVASFFEKDSVRIDAIVFNAGTTDRSDFLSIKPESWNQVFTVHVNYPVFLLQRLYPLINEGGSVTFTGSLMAIHPHAMSLSYGVSKAAVHALVKNLVKFLEPAKIRVNAVAPGFVETDWQKGKPEAIKKNISTKLASGRFLDPDELTDIYLLLIRNGGMNGEVVVCDGAYDYK